MRDLHGRTVIALHELLDGRVAIAGHVKTKAFSQAALIVKQQALLGATGQLVQGPAQRPQEIPVGDQLAQLLLA